MKKLREIKNYFVPGPMAFLMSEFLERVLKKHEPVEIKEV